MKNKKVICITGPAGSGKTTLCKYLEKQGHIIINVDKLGHMALEISKNELCKEFGNILDRNGHVSREKLKQKLLSERDWEKLEEITHPVIRKLLKEEIKRHKGRKIIIDVAIPYTLRIQNLCDAIVRIDASKDILKKRLLDRGMDQVFVDNVLKKQEKETGKTDFIIENNGNLEEFLAKGLSLIEKL